MPTRVADVSMSGFTDDQTGTVARETAKLFPIYVFPGPVVQKSEYSFANNRQAPIIDGSWSLQIKEGLNPLGIRRIFFVNYTPKAFSKECAEIIEYLTKKNGLASDDTPMIKTTGDIKELLYYEMITLDPPTMRKSMLRDRFIIGPAIVDPTKGVIADDAFIWMAEKDGKWLPSEEIVSWHFGCLQAKGDGANRRWKLTFCRGME